MPCFAASGRFYFHILESNFILKLSKHPCLIDTRFQPCLFREAKKPENSLTNKGHDHFCYIHLLVSLLALFYIYIIFSLLRMLRKKIYFTQKTDVERKQKFHVISSCTANIAPLYACSSCEFISSSSYFNELLAMMLAYPWANRKIVRKTLLVCSLLIPKAFCIAERTGISSSASINSSKVLPLK